MAHIFDAGGDEKQELFLEWPNQSDWRKPYNIGMTYKDIFNYLGTSDFASSDVSGHKFAKVANSNLCNFFCIKEL